MVVACRLCVCEVVVVAAGVVGLWVFGVVLACISCVVVGVVDVGWTLPMDVVGG